ncbi:RNA polymerase sigma factor ShbA [Prauserella muralis]|uniref:RNA polymerase subunit sigma-70 n=1 Tax=Prauserella muralis TaxID=588067 RepID=A0A2V4B0T9_9PSEU|nr:RNA polymerase sigma factor ShbA [Prauserella muralis]PXY27881.1 RNA polymerase subunit sigma-70 [Prauserella muralis]TWE22346.1 RNA polymerase sigma-70 factor (ECF subfamily) [Prauserella muralis]
MKEKTLAELVTAAQSGDEEATNELFTRLSPIIVRYCRARISPNGRGHASADDVAQEVFLAVLKALPRFQGAEEGFVPFVYGIAAHKVADHYRATGRDRTQSATEPTDEPDPSPGPEQRALTSDLGARMRTLLDQLPPIQREIIVLRVAVGWTSTETAAAVGWSPTAVRVAQHRALGKLRRQLGPGSLGDW